MGILYEQKTRTTSFSMRDRLDFLRHLHKEVELVLMLEGETSASVDSGEYVLHPGDLFIAFPNKVHSYHTYTREKSYLMIVLPDLFPEYKNIFGKQVPREPVIRAEKLDAEVYALADAMYHVVQSEEPLKKEIFRGYCAAFFGKVLPLMIYEPAQSVNNDLIPAMLRYCEEHYAEELSLDILSSNLHASKYYLSRLFSEKLKVSFSGYVNMLRVGDARERLLNTDESITSVGTSVGYNTTRSFNRAFLAMTGISPREYRRRYADAKSTDVHSYAVEPERPDEQTEIGCICDECLLY